MKRILSGLLPVCCFCWLLSGCTDTASLTEEELMPVQLCAGGGALEGVATRTEPGEAFTASVAFSSVKGEYASLDGEYEGIWAADVSAAASGTDGTVSWNTGGGISAPVYPRYGDYLYLVAYTPVQTPVNGTVTYNLTGNEDLLYVNELQGNRWDGNLFFGNKLASRDKPLKFEHLLTRLKFVACKKQTGGPEVKINKITVNGVETQAVLTLATGDVAFSTPSGKKGVALIPANGGMNIADTTPVEVGCLMLPPADTPDAYTLTVETSVGTYDSISISYGEAAASTLLRPGVSHEVKLSIGDHELSVLSVTVEPWTLVPSGELNIGERD